MLTKLKEPEATPGKHSMCNRHWKDLLVAIVNIEMLRFIVEHKDGEPLLPSFQEVYAKVIERIRKDSSSNEAVPREDVLWALNEILKKHTPSEVKLALTRCIEEGQSFATA